ncbi:hypothetical protein BGW36DRAFT_273130, partial [Talaromyces proteolyticus]
DATSLYSEASPLLLPSKDGSAPGFAPAQSLSRGLQIPSRSYRLTSGFEYPAVLSAYNVSEEDWRRFTSEITEQAKLSSSQWRTVIGVGLGTMAVGGMMLGFFGAVPAVIAARKKRAHQENRNVAASMASDSESALSHKISDWNESFFKPRGLVIRIDMPFNDDESLWEMDVTPSSSRSGSVVSLPMERTEAQNTSKEKEKARSRGRIVIVPLNQRPSSVMSQATTLAEESRYMPVVYD